MYIVFNIVILYWPTLLLFAVWNSELKWTAEKTLCEKYFFLLRQIRQFWCNARFFLYYMTLKKDVFSCDCYYKLLFLIIVEKIELVSSLIYSQPYANMESRLYNTLYKTWWKYPPSFRWIFNHLLRMQK